MPPLRHKAIRLAPLACDTPNPVSWTGPDGELFEPDWAETLYANLQRYRLRDWAKTAAAFEADPGDFYAAYHYLNNHPIFYRFHPWKDQSATLEHERHLIDDMGLEAIHLMVVKVDPKTLRIEKDDTRNTRTRIWWEAGPWLWWHSAPEPERQYLHPEGIGQHDLHLDGGADTYEQAIVELAGKIHRRYGNDRRKVHW